MPAISVASAEVIRPIVLVVDDDAGVREALRALLAPRLDPIYSVETAGSAEEALELAATVSPDTRPVAAVISDERMPGKQGTELLVALRQSPAHRHGGRIIITGYAGLESAKIAINEAEVVRYYPKPWDDERELLPALAGILARFTQAAGLDECLVAETRDWGQARTAIEGIRRSWWEYTALMGLDAAAAEVDEPAFAEPADGESMHLLVTRRSPRGDSLAASLRLERTSDEGTRAIAAVAFVPGEANETTETLIVRTALLEARRLGAARVRVEVPGLRREIYDALGFHAGAEPDGPAGIVAMSAATTAEAAVDGPGATHARRHERERRQCQCAQTACPSRDYAAPSRSYLCPLDALEGRVPRGFPAGPRA
jgi:CheY-like chemotaxis protein